ncbi:MAG TPA: YetF domain-containing protein [Chthoniobacter sp.]|nr:YetF domain-containing protein [Chthoniobacter sp.]
MDPGAGNLWTFNGGVWWHFIVRAAIVYFMVLVFIRVSGKRQVGQMTPFDLVLLLLISNAVQNSMNGGDNSITAGFILAGTLILVDVGLGLATRRSRKLEKIVDGEAEILIHNGKLRPGALERAGLTQHELMAALRESDCAKVGEVHTAILETNGRITVLTRKGRE